MTKNVTIIAENGTYVGTTYPKRAKGLIRNGRALFVDDCTIRLFAKAEPSGENSNQSEVEQMNYIYFNPRKWSWKQTLDSNTQSSIERSFINDFDGSLVECLLLGGWNDAYVKADSACLSLLPDTEYQFVFWLNGGENDKSSEICQLQITFFDQQEDCYTYKLNRNFIKPLLHKQGWELYSIPFMTPGSEQSTVSTVLSFIAGYAPMAVKPAKEPSTYDDWADEPDEFAAARPQRHNLVFEDGWPSINMYGGDKYSTEVLRGKRDQTEKQHRQVMHGVAENVQQMAQGFATNAKQMARDLAQSTRQMADLYKKNVEQKRNWSESAAELSQRLNNCKERQESLIKRQEELTERRNDLQSRYTDLQTQYHPEEAQGAPQLDTGFAEMPEWETDLPAMLSLNAQLSCLPDMLAKQHLPVETVEGVLDGVDCQLDNMEELFDTREELLDNLEELLDEVDMEELFDSREELLDRLEELLDEVEDEMSSKD